MIIKNINEFSMKMIVLILIGTFIFAAFSNVTAKHASFSSMATILHIQEDENSLETIFLGQIRANNTVNYTQLCLDYYISEYGEDKILVADSSIQTTGETGVNYTIVIIRHTLEDGRINHTQVSINQLTLHIEFGTHQIQDDYAQYISELPKPYNKLDSFSRKIIIGFFGDLPDVITLNSSTFCAGYMYMNIENYSHFSNLINSSYEEIDIEILDTGDTFAHIYFDRIKMDDFMTILNSSFIKSGLVVNVTYEVNTQPYPLTSFYLLILFSCSIIIIIYFIKRKKKCKGKQKIMKELEGDK